MRKTLATVAAAITLGAGIVGTAPARADWGAGAFTYNEWLSLHSGQAKFSVEDACGCTGTWVNSPGTNPKEFFYDNTLTGGTVREFYVYQNGYWRTFGSYWCDRSSNCQQDF